VSSLPHVAVIGAGPSGLATVKALRDRGVPVTCFDRADRIGGTWAFENSSGLSAAYRDLHINVSRARMQFEDLPMEHGPDFAHHSEVVTYFERYARHFRLRDDIILGTGVDHARRLPGGGWDLELDDGSTCRADALVVANGHHSEPNRPHVPGTFSGTVLHAHDYRDNAFLRDRDVVVVGMGNSAMDIAVESSAVARQTYLSTRRGAHVMPKYVLGRPYDMLPGHAWMLGRGVSVGPVNLQIPWRARQAALQAAHRLLVGRMDAFGLPAPDHRFGESHPSISGRLLERIGHGRIAPRPSISSFDGDRVRFEDGSAVQADVVVLCTGYRITFPFLDDGIAPVRENRIDLFHRIFRPGLADLAFVGLVQPLGSIMQIAEGQARWVAAHFAGAYALPDEAEMWRTIAADRERLERRYVASPRHTIQVDQEEHLWRLRREQRRGERRAAGRARKTAAVTPVPNELVEV